MEADSLMLNCLPPFKPERRYSHNNQRFLNHTTLRGLFFISSKFDYQPAQEENEAVKKSVEQAIQLEPTKTKAQNRRKDIEL